MISMPLKYHGGKSYVAKKIKSFFPVHKVLAVPFLGGGSIPFAWEPEAEEVVNDLDPLLMNFYSELKDFGWKLKSSSSMTRFSKEAFDWSLAFLEYQKQVGEVDKPSLALAYFIRNRMSRQALGKDFCTPTTRLRRGMEEHLSAWLSAVDSLPHFSKRLKNVGLFCEDFLSFMRRYDDIGTLFYLDPPYPKGTRVATKAYSYEMSDERHCDLLNFLACCRGKFVLSGYRSELYDSMAEACGWYLTEFGARVASSSARSKRMATECLWTNFPVC